MHMPHSYRAFKPESTHIYTNLIDRWITRCNSSRVIQSAMPIVCLLFQTTLLQRVVYFYPEQITHQIVPAPLIAILFLVPPLILLLRQKYANLVLLAHIITLICAYYLNLNQYFSLPILFAMYTVVARSHLKIAPALTILAGTVYLYSMSKSDFTFNSTVPHLTILAVVILMGIMSRMLWIQHRARQKYKTQQAQSLESQAKAEKIKAQNKIAAELHDSVGHKLTAIITLSESLLEEISETCSDIKNSTTSNIHTNDSSSLAASIPNLNYEVIQMINNLARKGLADTRQAVDALNDPSLIIENIHSIDDIHADIAALSSLNLPIKVIEHGIKNLSLQTEDILYRVMRESLTNALRHNPELQSILMELDYTPCNEKITARIKSVGLNFQTPANPTLPDNAASKIDSNTADDNCFQPKSKNRNGGLEQLRHTIESLGGTMQYGPQQIKSYISSYFKTQSYLWEVYVELPPFTDNPTPICSEQNTVKPMQEEL